MGLFAFMLLTCIGCESQSFQLELGRALRQPVNGTFGRPPVSDLADSLPE